MITANDIGQRQKFVALAGSAIVRPVGKDGKYMLSATLTLPGGQSIGAVHWDVQQDAAVGLNGTVIETMGEVNVYKDSLQIVMNGTRVVKDPDMGQFSESTVQPVDEIMAELFRYVVTIKDPALRAVCETLHKDSGASFRTLPAGTRMHHARVGGLAEHTLQVAKIALSIWDSMSHLKPQPCRDLVLAGALLHDIGKTLELTKFPFEYTADGSLLGHQTLALGMICRAAEDAKESPIILHLLHVVAGSHDTVGQASMVAKTPEAFIVHCADRTSSGCDGMIGEIRRALEVNPEAASLPWSHQFDRKLFATPIFGLQENSNEEAPDDGLPY